MIRPPPRSTLVPFTTLFRSSNIIGSVLGSLGSACVWASIGPQAVVVVQRANRHLASSANSYTRSEDHTSELQSPCNIVCRLLLEKKTRSSTSTLWHSRVSHT